MFKNHVFLFVYKGTSYPIWGEEVYKWLTNYFGSQLEASKFLNVAGFNGIVDENTYTVFNDKDIKILNVEKY